MMKIGGMLFWKVFVQILTQLNIKLNILFQMPTQENMFLKYNQNLNLVWANSLGKHLFPGKKQRWLPWFFFMPFLCSSWNLLYLQCRFSLALFSAFIFKGYFSTNWIYFGNVYCTYLETSDTERPISKKIYV